MRRAELASSDPDLFQFLAEHCREGYLSLVTASGFPRSLAVDFAAIGQSIYYHGALAGEKYERILADSRVGFSMVQPLSFIPSTWSSPTFACPATHLFRSVEIKGHCFLLDDPVEKGRGLQALMTKYQPEGGYIPIKGEENTYRKAIDGVGVFRVDPESWTAKVKLMQNESARNVWEVVDHLRKRGEPIDLLTADLMEQNRNENGAGRTDPA